MGPGIIIPVAIIAVVVPVVLVWAKRSLKDGGGDNASADDVIASGSRLTSSALRELPSPPWRVVYEIAADRLGGVEHVLIGPAGVFAIRTSMAALPADSDEPPDPHRIAESAIVRGELDDALRRCAMSSDSLVSVHWGAPVGGTSQVTISVDVFPGLTAVDGRSLGTWAAAQPEQLSTAQVDLAWQTVTTAIGRPDPLA